MIYSIKQKLDIFYKVAQALNNELNIVPILYGSLGLYRVLQVDREASDIDVLISDEFVGERWPELNRLMMIMGYKLIDESEHEYEKDDQVVAFAAQSDLQKLNNIDPQSLNTTREGEVEFRELTPRQYLACYQTVYKDEYRRNKNKGADLDKIELIKNNIQNE